MNFDGDGHFKITPAELEALLRTDIDRLINSVLLSGTPSIFAAYSEYCEFREMIAKELSLHPSSIVFRGSTKIGFSLSPRPEKLWYETLPTSDVDLAIVDPDHFHFLDAEVRLWERSPEVRAQRFRGQNYRRIENLREGRAFYCYKYMHLPDTSLVHKYQAAMNKASALKPPGCNRPVTAFFFRDWWSLHSRYEFDLNQVLRGLQTKVLPPGGSEPKKHN